jgi:hypothetical protein
VSAPEFSRKDWRLKNSDDPANHARAGDPDRFICDQAESGQMGFVPVSGANSTGPEQISSQITGFAKNSDTL